MKIKNFYLNVDDDKVLFEKIVLEEDGSIPERLINKDYTLSNNPELLNISHLNYGPAMLSIWNGTDFIAPEGEDHKPACGASCENGCVTFAFLRNNIFNGMKGLCIGMGNNDMIIAAILSNPTITYDIIDL